jgi:biotin carboxylase
VTHVVFVAPHFLANTLRYIEAFASLDVQLSLISHDVEEKLPPGLRSKIAGHYRVKDCMNGEQLFVASKAIHKGVGPIDRLTGALEQLQTPMAAVREAMGIDGMWNETARRFRDKDRMKEVLRASNVPVARSELVRSKEELRRFVGEVGLPIVVKPQAGLGARATQRVTTIAELDALLAQDRQWPLQAEEFVRAREHTCETVTIRGTPVWRSGTRYFPGPLEVLETPWIQYCVLLPRETDDPTFTRFHPINEAALTALGVGTALTHMEWFHTESGRMLVNEVGARPPGVHIMPMMSAAHEVDMIHKWAELIAFDRFTPCERKWAAGAAFFRAQGSGTRVRAIHGVEAALESVGRDVIDVRWPQIGQARAESYEGEGWAIVKHATTDGAKHALHELISHVRVELG